RTLVCNCTSENFEISGSMLTHLPEIVRERTRFLAHRSREHHASPQRNELFSCLPNRMRRHSIVAPTQSRAELHMQEAANGTRRQKSPRSPVHRTGGPFPKR